MTLKLVMDRLCRSGTSRLAHVVLVAQPVPVGQAYWNRLCLSHWHKQAGCTKPVLLGLGEVKRDLAPWHKSYTHDGDLSLCHGTSSIPRWSLYLFQLCQLVPQSGSTRPCKIRPSHQRTVSIEFLTICRIAEFPKSEQNRKSCGNVRI